METELLDPLKNSDAIYIASNYIKHGEVVGIPTETVYGLAANALNGEAVRKIFIAKGRPQDNPLIVHIADFMDIYQLVSDVPEHAKLLAEKFWPGPLTMILPKSKLIPDEVSAGLESVGIRLPSHPIARQLIRASGVPLAAPSANTSGRPSTTTAQHVWQDMNGKIPAIIDGGVCDVGVESTVISLCGDIPTLLRPGGISIEELRAVLGEIVVDKAIKQQISDTEKVSSPGMKYRHYAPKAKVKVICGHPNQTAQYIKKNISSTSGVLCFDEYEYLFTENITFKFGESSDIKTQAQRIFDLLRHFDDTDVTDIYAQCPNDSGIGLAVANRLKKAAGFDIIDLGCDT